MKEIGRVTEVGRGTVTLALESESACSGCAARGGEPAAGCPVCAVFSSEKLKTIDAVVRGGLALAVGDRVVVYYDPKKTAATALLVFVLPLAALLLGYGAVALLRPSAAEAWRFLGGAAGFALSFLFVFLRRLVRKTKDWPEVIEKCGDVQDEVSRSNS
jgi:positive regulator of sigma E activity